MSDDTHRPENEESSPGLDLSGLNELSLGPDWGSGKLPEPKTPRARGRDRDERPRGGPAGVDSGRRGPPRDRRGDRRGEFRRQDGPPRDRHPEAGERPKRRPRREERGEHRGRPQREAPFRPLLEADFYPDDAAFKALTHAIKTSCRTFELFEIAHLILEKPERWVCVARHPDQKEGEEALLIAAIKDGLPFLDEQAALNHVFSTYLGDFFEVEEYEADPPAGSFQVVHRCGMTGELLAPPNYHRYQAIIREHHSKRLANVPFERFQQRIESVRDEEAIQAWLEKMKKRTRFTLKPEFVPAGKEAPVFNQAEDARIYLIAHHKDKLIRPAYSVRILGKDVALLPEEDPLRRSIEALHQQQLQFPLATANNLRGRLRRLNFAVYKKGAKGVSYVCAVKRRFRQPGEVLAENLSDLIAFIEAHPDLKASDLPEKYLGVAPEKTAGTAAGEQKSPAEAAEEKPASEVESAADAEVASSEPEGAQPEPEDSEPKQAAASPGPRLTAEQEQVLALRRDLRYLVSQGYVIEYSDGRLFVPPVRDDAGGSREDDDSPSPAKAAKTAQRQGSRKADEPAPPKAESEGKDSQGEPADPNDSEGGAAEEPTSPTDAVSTAEAAAPDMPEAEEAAASAEPGASSEANSPDEEQASEVTGPPPPAPESAEEPAEESDADVEEKAKSSS